MGHNEKKAKEKNQYLIETDARRRFFVSFGMNGVIL